MDKKLEELYEIIGDKDRVISGNKIDEKYKSDVLNRLKGEVWAVVRTLSTLEVSKVMAFATLNEIPITPRGAGTNLVGSTVPVDGGIVLDLTGMNKILELDKETFTITVEPGVLLQDLQEYVDKENFFYPPDPGEKASTIGGNISTNAGGMRAVKYGVTRDYVMGLEIVLSDGRILNIGSKNIKDSSGLSLKHLIIGSEGTLAIITKCILKIIPKPQSSVTIVLPYKTLENGIENVQRIINQNANPTAIEFVEKRVISLGESFLGLSFPYPDAGAYIILTFDGNTEEIEININLIKELAKKHGALDFIRLTDKKELDNVWKIRGALVKAVEAVSEQEPVDIVVPINKTVEFIDFVNNLSAKSDMQIVSFGHAGDGNIHLCVLRGERTIDQWKKDLNENMEKIYKKAYELGGLTSGEHGIGLSKKKYFQNETDKNNLDIMREIKNSLDSKNILNNKKVYMA